MEIPLHHFFNSRTDPRTLDVLTRGPLAPHLQAYAQRLHDDGYATQSGQLQLRLLGHFNGWLERQRIAATEVDSSTLEPIPTSSTRKDGRRSIGRLIRDTRRW